MLRDIDMTSPASVDRLRAAVAPAARLARTLLGARAVALVTLSEPTTIHALDDAFAADPALAREAAAAVMCAGEGVVALEGGVGVVAPLFDRRAGLLALEPRHTDAWRLDLFADAARLADASLRAERLDDEIQAQRLEFFSAAHLANFGVWSFDVASGTLFWSDHLYELHGLDGDTGITLEAAVASYEPDAQPRVREAMRRLLEEGESFEIEEAVLRANGQRRWLRGFGAPTLRQGRIVRAHGCVQDVTDEVTTREDIALLASRDYLTEVANRANFTNHVEKRIRLLDPSVESLFVLLIDVDHFKNINDSFGHDVGDNILREVTRILSRSVRSGDLVGRLGGDEFGVFVCAPSRSTLGVEVAERILTAASESPAMRAVGGGVTLSIGVAEVTGSATSFKAVVKAADLALYEAKRNGRNRAAQYSASLGLEYERRERIMAAVDVALKADEFEPWYQPKVRIATGLVESFEALARWRHPERGLLSPGAFVDALEDIRMSTRISERMLEQGVRDFGRLKRALGRSPGRLAVNVTEKMISDPGFPEALSDLLLANGLSNDEFEIEITEAVLLARKVAEIRANLERLAASGVEISLDDFGTGYASLAHLRTFPLDCIKIDMSFIRDLDTNRESWIISKAVIGMAHDLQMEVVAEGVERAEVADLLDGLGCDVAQGYYYARPLPIDGVVDLIRATDGLLDPRKRVTRVA